MICALDVSAFMKLYFDFPLLRPACVDFISASVMILYLNSQQSGRPYLKTKELFKVTCFEILHFISYFERAAVMYLD